MKPLKSIMLFLMLVSVPAMMQAKDKKPSKLPAAFNHASYVYVEAVDGQQFDPRVYPEDLKAIGDVQDAIYAWNRYTLTTQREQADLIFVVRKGRLAAVDAGVQVSPRPKNGPGRFPNPSGPNSGPSVGTQVGGQAGPPDDLLEVYEPNPSDRRGTLLWQRTLEDGLDAPKLTLFKQLKDRVERDYPNQSANNSHKP